MNCLWVEGGNEFVVTGGWWAHFPGKFHRKCWFYLKESHRPIFGSCKRSFKHFLQGTLLFLVSILLFWLSMSLTNLRRSSAAAPNKDRYETRHILSLEKPPRIATEWKVTSTRVCCDVVSLISFLKQGNGSPAILYA